MEHLAHLEAPIVLIVLSWLVVLLVGLYLQWRDRRKK
jgi:hypothetical protein